MENPRPEKVAIVDEVRQRLTSADAVYVTEYRGLNVKALSTLRRELRTAGGSYKVYKNTLVRRAASEVGMDIDDLLVGPTALAFVETTPDGAPGDVVTVAKTLRDFAKANPNLIVKGGVLDNNVIDADGMKALADVEPREVLLAKLAGAIAAPMQQFASLMQALPRNLAYGLQALIDQRGGVPTAASDDDSAGTEVHAEAAPEAVADESVTADPAPEAESASADVADQATAEETPPADAGEENES